MLFGNVVCYPITPDRVVNAKYVQMTRDHKVTPSYVMYFNSDFVNKIRSFFIEQPPRPSEVSDVTGSFYRHLTITVPLVSSFIVLVLVICVVCLVTKRRTPGCRPRTPDGKNIIITI